METEKSVQQLNPDYILESNGKKFVRYIALIELAVRMGLQSLEVEVIQIASEANGNTAICKATAQLKNGKKGSDIGEANPSNLNHQVSGHIYSMASTRAKARCLRNVLGVGMCSVEELTDLGTVVGDTDIFEPEKEPVQTNPSAKPGPKASASEPKLITPAQEKAIRGMANRQNLDPQQLSHDMFKTSLETLSRRDASKLFEHLKSQAA